MTTLNLDMLNPAQKEAVLTTNGPLLVLAGAGSGKTRVLTHRIAHMIADEGVQPWQILAITFTNKAAQEMRDRLERLVDSTRGMWVCTFHAMCVRMLRSDAERLGFTSNFTIYDDQDSKRLVKEILRDLKYDDDNKSFNFYRSRISDFKNAHIEPDEVEDPRLRHVYMELQNRLKRSNAMDFDDLLLNADKLLRENIDVLESYQDRFIKISVDEYQDTNHVQYEITNLLAAKHKNLMVVGDDDQSIYSWRGADIQNILDFEKDYPEAKVIKLEENYRSTGHILNAANAVVANNARRKEKHLFTEMGDGELVQLYRGADERDEGRWVASEIDKVVRDNNYTYDDVAVMYRTNAQSRILEDMMLRAGIPFKMVGGTRFFDRAEIRDVMAYLKLVVNPADDVSALRIINTPKRGIGATSIAKIQSYAYENRLTFLEAVQLCSTETGLLTAKCRSSLADFYSKIQACRKLDGELAEIVREIVDQMGIIAAYDSEKTSESIDRKENVKEFIEVAREFDETHQDSEESLLSMDQLRAAGFIQKQPGVEAVADIPILSIDRDGLMSKQLPQFMEWLALRSDLDSLDGQTSAVTMMTVHSAKGLEYPVVFLTGMEERIFPHIMPGENENAKIEEERRLAYVAITRAQRHLYITNASTRSLFGKTTANRVSRFLEEIPAEDIHRIGVGSDNFKGFGWEKRGDRHGTFGSGQGEEMYGGRVFGAATRSSNIKNKERRSFSSFMSEVACGVGGSDTTLKPTSSASPLVRPSASAIFTAGDIINHKTFGVGKVISVDGDKICIQFERTGKIKQLMKGYAPIVKIG